MTEVVVFEMFFPPQKLHLIFRKRFGFAMNCEFQISVDEVGKGILFAFSFAKISALSNVGLHFGGPLFCLSPRREALGNQRGS